MEPMVWDGERNGVIFGRGDDWHDRDDDSNGRGDDWDGWGDDWDDRGDGSNGRGEKFFAPTTIGKSLIIIIP